MRSEPLLPNIMPINSALARQAEIDESIKISLSSYANEWRKFTTDWRQASQDAVWLTYAANYLLHTAGVHWAMDPYALPARLKHRPLPAYQEDLSALQLVAFTHAHADHLDLNLVAALQDSPITWIIPGFMQERIRKVADLSRMRVILPEPGVPIQFDALTLLPFDGLHIRGDQGVPEIGYLAKFNGQRWLFPGDTRVYEPTRLPDFGHLDGIFAHLWLGKACALHSPPSLLEEFCTFFVSLQPKHLIISHLKELGRVPEDFWTETHFQAIQNRLALLAPEIQVQMAKCCQKINLE